MKASEKSTN